jgi:hypothetical protein
LEKLEQNRFRAIDLWENSFALLAAAVTAYARPGVLVTKFRSRIIRNLVVVGTFSLLAYTFAANVTHSVLEPLYIANSPLVTELAAKYNFSIFDFALAKKEATLKELTNEISSSARFYFNS